MLNTRHSWYFTLNSQLGALYDILSETILPKRFKNVIY